MAIHLHSLVDFDWRATTKAFDLVRASGLPYYYTLHDYSVLCHRNSLVLTDGRYCGLPDVEACRRCVAGDRSYPEALDPAVRRDSYGAFLEGATAVFAPSRDIADRLHRAGARYVVAIRPHEEAEIVTPRIPAKRFPARKHDPLDIVVVGAIGAHKGSAVLLALARDAKARDLPLRFHVVGYTNVKAELKDLGVTETGAYADNDEAAARVEAIAPAVMLVPSIWPETFCYTLSLAFRFGVMPVVFDLGAQAARVREAGFGVVMPLALVDDPAALNDRLLDLSPDSLPAKPLPVTRYANILRDYYGLSSR